MGNTTLRSRSRKPKRYFWSTYADDELLELRFCDLELRLEKSWIESIIERVRGELAAQKLRLKPHFWLSSEFFSPEGVPGVGIPFYLAHPRLMRLEQRQMLEVEGGTERECLRLVRHEVGHAVQTAYQVQKRRKWQRQFGASSTRYPDWYRPHPRSRRYVHHLDFWYAQSHPDEDFAETFAVWLDPRSQWRRRYKKWPALKKLEYVDELMAELAGAPTRVRSREQVDSLPKLRTTLRDHYEERKEHFMVNTPDVYDPDLRKIFSDDPTHRARMSAVNFLRRNRVEIRGIVSNWTTEYEYTVDLVLRDMIKRCRTLKLRLRKSERETKLDFIALLTLQTTIYLYAGRWDHPL